VSSPASRARSTRVPRVRPLLVVAVALAIVAVAPEPVVLGGLRLAAYATAASGATLLVSRTGAPDLAIGGMVAAGAYLGGVASALLSLPVAVGLPAGLVAGALVGAASGAMHGRLGWLLGALTSLTLGGAVVAVLGAWPPGGGAAGFHAVGLPTPFGDRADLVAIGGLLLVALLAYGRTAGHRWSAAGSVAVRAPTVAASLGRSPARDAARVGAMAGGLLGLGGVSLAAVDGSVFPAAYGLELTAALALAALLGGPSVLGPVVGTLLVWGPGVVLPLVPWVGTAPPLLVMGPVGLAVLALRRGRPLLASPTASEARRGPEPAPDVDPAPTPRSPNRQTSLGADGLATPAGRLDLRLEPGEVVALVGPNGAGKSTALARLGGQLPDGGAASIGGVRAPRGAAARARGGLARTWQRPPDVPDADVERLLLGEPEAREAARWARGLLRDDHGSAPLVWVAARGPAIALFDEPTDVPPERLAAYLRGLADAGTAVLVVDHRPEVRRAADRVITLGGEGPA
jgi:ABC-type branched-subunit amino acid transport system permease subunit